LTRVHDPEKLVARLIGNCTNVQVEGGAVKPQFAEPSAQPDYQILDESSAEAYVRRHPMLDALVGSSEPLIVREVGDGNLNLVFVIRPDPASVGLVLKQALPWVRVHGPSWALTPKRAIAEARAYAIHQKFAADFIPRFFAFDRENYVLAMEDLSDLRNWREALNDGDIHQPSAHAVGEYVALVAFHTSAFGLESESMRALAAESSNPELCRITEDLVLTEPFVTHEHNWHHPALDAFVADFRKDAGVLDEVSQLKMRFLTTAEALIHGDLHTGSVMVGGGRTVALDPEFCFFGPVAFDLGALWANFIIAAARAWHLKRPVEFQEHVASLLPVSWQAFTDKLRELWPSRADQLIRDAALEAFLERTWTDALGFAGAKMTRRMIGYAHVTDIESLTEPERSRAALGVLCIARRLLLERRSLRATSDVAEVIAHELARTPASLAGRANQR
jgi:5-methylthioribose kinase